MVYDFTYVGMKDWPPNIEAPPVTYIYLRRNFMKFRGTSRITLHGANVEVGRSTQTDRTILFVGSLWQVCPAYFIENLGLLMKHIPERTL